MMSLRIFRVALVLFLCKSLAFSPVVFAEQLALPSGDLIAPQISFSPISEAIDAGSALELSATVTDNVGIQSVTLFYRTIGTSEYERVALQPMGEADEYSVEIGAVQTPGIEYYIQATDLAGNTLLRGYSFSPLVVNVNATDAPSTAVDPATTSVATLETRPEMETEKSSKKWLWIGLGVLAVGAIAASSGGGSDNDNGGSGGGDSATGAITISGSPPP